MNWYLAVLKKYAEFTGRARRKEYWMFFLFSLIASIVLMIVDKITGTYSAHAGVGLLGGLYGLATLIPGLAVTVRRLHDTGRSGWWILICLIPLSVRLYSSSFWQAMAMRRTINTAAIQSRSLNRRRPNKTINTNRERQ